MLSKFEENNLFVFDTNRKKTLSYSPYEYKRRQTNDVSNIGHSSAPVVVGDLRGIKQIKPSHLFAFGYNYSVTLDKWNISDMAADVIYIGNNTLPFDIPGTLSIVCEYINWNDNFKHQPGVYPIVEKEMCEKLSSDSVFFVRHFAEDNDTKYLLNYPNAIVVLNNTYSNKTQLFRSIRMTFDALQIQNPVILSSEYNCNDPELFQLWSASDLGASFIDGFGDGVWLKSSL